MICGESGIVDFKEQELQLPSNVHKSCPLFLPAQQRDTEQEPGEQGWYLYNHYWKYLWKQDGKG